MSQLWVFVRAKSSDNEFPGGAGAKEGSQPHGDDREALGNGGSKKLKAPSLETF